MLHLICCFLILCRKVMKQWQWVFIKVVMVVFITMIVKLWSSFIITTYIKIWDSLNPLNQLALFGNEEYKTILCGKIKGSAWSICNGLWLKTKRQIRFTSSKIQVTVTKPNLVLFGIFSIILQGYPKIMGQFLSVISSSVCESFLHDLTPQPNNIKAGRQI